MAPAIPCLISYIITANHKTMQRRLSRRQPPKNLLHLYEKNPWCTNGKKGEGLC